MYITGLTDAESRRGVQRQQQQVQQLLSFQWKVLHKPKKGHKQAADLLFLRHKAA